MSLGDFALGSGPIDFKFTTVDSTGLATALASGSIAVFVNNSPAGTIGGVTLTANFGGLTGVNHVRVDPSADGLFYGANSMFQVVGTAGTVAGVSFIGYTEPSWVFTLERTSALRPTVAGRTLDVNATGNAGIDWANISDPSTNQALSATTISAVTGAVGSVTGNVGGNVAGSVGSVTGNVGGNVVGNVNGSVASVTGNVGGNVVGTVGTVNALAANSVNASALAADAVDEIWDEVMEGTVTARQSMRLANTANGAKLSGAATTTVVIRDVSDTKDRVTATVDADGNRTAVTLDLA